MLQISTKKKYEMRLSEKAQQIEIWDFLMNNQNIMFGYTLPIEKIEKSINVNQLILMNAQFFFNRPFSTQGI